MNAPVRHLHRNAKPLTREDLEARLLELSEQVRRLRAAPPPTSTLDTQLDTVARLLDSRPSLTVKEVAGELHVSIKTAHRRLVELARRGRAHVFFEAHAASPNTARLRAVHPDRVVLDLA